MPKRDVVKVVQQENEPPVPVEIIAQSIIRLDEAVKKMLSSGLNEYALIVLLADSSRLSKTAIRILLRSLKTLRQTYCTR